jgi:hypothetical protein
MPKATAWRAPSARAIALSLMFTVSTPAAGGPGRRRVRSGAPSAAGRLDADHRSARGEAREAVGARPAGSGFRTRGSRIGGLPQGRRMGRAGAATALRRAGSTRQRRRAWRDVLWRGAAAAADRHTGVQRSRHLRREYARSAAYEAALDAGGQPGVGHDQQRTVVASAMRVSASRQPGASAAAAVST